MARRLKAFSLFLEGDRPFTNSRNSSFFYVSFSWGRRSGLSVFERDPQNTGPFEVSIPRLEGEIESIMSLHIEVTVKRF